MSEVKIPCLSTPTRGIVVQKSTGEKIQQQKVVKSLHFLATQALQCNFPDITPFTGVCHIHVSILSMAKFSKGGKSLGKPQYNVIRMIRYELGMHELDACSPSVWLQPRTLCLYIYTVSSYIAASELSSCSIIGSANNSERLIQNCYP